MRRLVVAGLLALAVLGCARGPYWTQPPTQSLPVYCDNPTLLPIADHEHVWEMVVDVVDDFFRIEREEPVRLVGDVLTEGRIDTFPQGSPTALEPWRPDAAGTYQIVENTLQSMRRQAIVRVLPAEGGYWVDVAVFKELEDVVRPQHATAGAATLRYDETLTRVVNPVGEQEIHRGWIPQGRDTALEQRILRRLHARCERLPVRTLPQVVP